MPRIMGLIAAAPVVAVWLVASSGLARAQAAPAARVAIVPGIAVNLDTARVDALSQDLADALTTELEVQATGGLELRRMLPPEGVPADCVTTPACITDVARRTGATQLLFVVMVDSGAGGSIQIDATWVDTATGRTESRPALDLTSATEARARFQSAARQLLPDAPARARATPTATVIAPRMTEGVARRLTTPAKIPGAVALVGLGAGIAFGLTTRSKFERCENDPVMCTDEDRRSIRTSGAIADTGFVIATGAALATVVLYLTSSEEPRLIVTPTADGGAVGVVGRF
jgi:hypothetical protein